jgi:hypothetical protein
MKKLLVLCAGLMLVASTAFAQGNGLHMSWTACPNTAGNTPNGDFLCDASEIHSLYGTVSVGPNAVAGVVAMDGIIDLLFQSADVPTFWQFQAGGCNETGAAISAAKPAAGCGAAAANTTTLCSAGGAGCSAFITAYAFGPVINQPPNRARLLIALARASTSPVNLAVNTGTNAHFAWNLNFFEDAAEEAGVGGTCVGCPTGVSLTWNAAVFYNTSATTGGEGTAAVITSGDPGSNANAFSNCAGCAAVPTRNRSWGQLKSMYR